MGFSIYAWITIATVLVTFGILLFTKLRGRMNCSTAPVRWMPC